jgi:integrase
MPYKFADDTDFKFTAAHIHKLPDAKPGSKGYFVADQGSKSSLPGLFVRIGEKGAKYFVFQARDRSGRQIRVTLGGFPTMTPDGARAEAVKTAARIREGRDPHVEKQELRAARAQAQADAALTLGMLIDQFGEKKLGLEPQEGEEGEKSVPRRKRARTRGVDSRYAENLIADLRRGYASWQKRPANSITRQELEARWEEMGDRPAAARALAAHSRQLFRWATSKGMLHSNPAAEAELPEKTESRDHEPTPEEARTIWLAAGQMKTSPAGRALIQYLLGTGARYTEGAETAPGELNADRSEWTIPAERTKNRKPHCVPIPPILRELLARLPSFAGSKYIFTADGKRAVTGSSHLKRCLDAAIVEVVKEGAHPVRMGFVIHDFRRAITGYMARSGLDPLIAEKVLGHITSTKLSAVGLIYNRYDYFQPYKEALERWTEYLAGEGTNLSTAPAAPAPAADSTISFESASNLPVGSSEGGQAESCQEERAESHQGEQTKARDEGQAESGEEERAESRDGHRLLDLDALRPGERVAHTWIDENGREITDWYGDHFIAGMSREVEVANEVEKELRIRTLMVIQMNDPEVREALAAERERLLGARPEVDSEKLFWEAVHWRAQLEVDPVPVIKVTAIDFDRTRFKERRRRCELQLREDRVQLKLAEAAHASVATRKSSPRLIAKSEATVRHLAEEVEGGEMALRIWDDMLASLDKPIPDNLLVENFGHWSIHSPEARARGAKEIMQDFFLKRTGTRCFNLVNAMEKALTKVGAAETPFFTGRSRRLRLAKARKAEETKKVEGAAG